MSLANISIVGNAVRTPEQREFEGGKKKTTVVVAVNLPGKQPRNGERNQADFYTVESWGQLGDVIHSYVGKGNRIGVTGRLTLDHWIDKQGKTRVTPIIKAEQVSLPPKLRSIEPAKSESGSTGTSQSSNYNVSNDNLPQTLDFSANPDYDSGQPAPVAVPVVPFVNVNTGEVEFSAERSDQYEEPDPESGPDDHIFETAEEEEALA